MNLFTFTVKIFV